MVDTNNQKDADRGITNPLKIIEQLCKLACKVKLGKNFYLETANLIRRLIKERADAYKKIDVLEKRIAELEAPKPPRVRVPFETEGNGAWDVE